MEIVKRIAINTAIDEDIINEVISHSLNALLRSSRNSESMEITGFGTFYLKKNRIPKYVINFEGKIEKLKVYLSSLSNKKSIDELSKRIEIAERDLNIIKKRYGLE